MTGKPNDEDRALLSSLGADGAPSRVDSASKAGRAAQTRAIKNGWATVDRSTWSFSITPAGLSALKEES